MKIFGASVTVFMHALVVIAMFAITIASAHAHVPDGTSKNAAHGISFGNHTHELDCTPFKGGGHQLHCHLKSPGAEATGPVSPLSDDQPELFVLAILPIARDIGIQSALAATHISITEPPCFILFGNFRS